MKELKVLGIILLALVTFGFGGKLAKDGAPRDEYEKWEEPEPGWLSTFLSLYYNPDPDSDEAHMCPSYHRPTIWPGPQNLHTILV